MCKVLYHSPLPLDIVHILLIGSVTKIAERAAQMLLGIRKLHAMLFFSNVMNAIMSVIQLKLCSTLFLSRIHSFHPYEALIDCAAVVFGEGRLRNESTGL